MDKLPKTKQELDQAIQQGIQTFMRSGQFNLTKIQSHEHNGVDTVKIKRENIINSVKKTTLLIDTNTTGGSLVVIDTIPNVSNLNRINFAGFIANNATGSATKRAIINGQAEIGQCYFTDSVQVVPATQNSIEACNYMYVDSTDLTKNRVGASNQYYLCYATDDTGAILVTTTVAYTNQTITFTTTLAAGWKLQGVLIIT